MPAYLIANLKVTDAKGFAAYCDLVMPIVDRFGGRYLVRGGAMEDVEGHLGLARLILLEFPSLEIMREFYESDEYAPLLTLRQASTISDVCFTEGYAP